VADGGRSLLCLWCAWEDPALLAWKRGRLQRARAVVTGLNRIFVVTASLIVTLAAWFLVEHRAHSYRVVAAERYDAHYDDTKQGLYCSLANEGTVCDLPEVHYTFLHKDVRLFTQCQAWDKKNKCGELHVGKTYQCERDGTGRPYVDFLSCDGATVDVLKETVQ
jgi:hypothetical protein